MPSRSASAGGRIAPGRLLHPEVQVRSGTRRLVRRNLLDLEVLGVRLDASANAGQVGGQQRGGARGRNGIGRSVQAPRVILPGSGYLGCRGAADQQGGHLVGRVA
jgi:hypothetical protein